MPLVLNIASVLHPWSVTYFYLYGIRLLTLHRRLVSWGRFLFREHIQRGELLLITIWDDPSKDYYEGLIVVIMATIPLPEREAREYDWTAVSLWLSGRSSLHRISIMGVLSHYYHLFNQIFTGRRNTGFQDPFVIFITIPLPVHKILCAYHKWLLTWFVIDLERVSTK